MALRVFTDRDGDEWSVWNVQPTASTDGLQERFRSGWLCFERADGTGRARLPMDEVPPGWESLPDERLALLRRVAEVASRPRGVTPTGVQRIVERDEDASRNRTSGPKHVIGSDDDESRAE
jgi:hypothetical protein